MIKVNYLLDGEKGDVKTVQLRLVRDDMTPDEVDLVVLDEDGALDRIIMTFMSDGTFYRHADGHPYIRDGQSKIQEVADEGRGVNEDA